MKFSYNWLKKYVDFKLSPGELSELLTLYAFEVEEVIEKEEGAVLDIDVLPNRASDCFSHLGVAREIKAILNIKEGKGLELIEPERKKLGKAKGSDKILVKNPDLCQRYSLGVMEQVSIGTSPEWLQEQLRVCGLEPINNIVDITNFVMLEEGQPLHAFDADKIAGNQIIVRQAKKGEAIETLDEKKHDLDQATLVIADKKGPLAIAGIKGGKRAAVTAKTKRIYIEAACFNPVNIRRTSRRLKIESDASKRFSQGLSPHFTKLGLARFIYLTCKQAQGNYKSWEDYYPEKSECCQLYLHFDKITEVLGVEIDRKTVEGILTELEFQFEKHKKDSYKVTCSYFRRDIKQEEDLVEEVARLYGYQEIPAQFPRLALVHPERCELAFWRSRIKDILAGFGYSEVMNFSFVGRDEVEDSGIDTSQLVKLTNPLSADLYYLRPNLGLSLLKSLREENKDSDIIRIFEVGKKMQFINERVQEKWELGILTDLGESRPTSFYELKGVVDSLLEELGLGGFYFDDADVSRDPLALFWHKGRQAEIRVGGRKIGMVGEIKPYLLDKIDCESCAALALLDVDMLAQLTEEAWEYHPPQKFPSIKRDLAILVDQDVRFAKVLSVINNLPLKFVKDVDLFDIYEGEEIPGGKKSLAFHIIYASDEKTLTDEEVASEHKQIEQALEKEIDAEIR